MVTGASSGIGRVAATHLASRGAHLVLVCRNRDKGEAVRAEMSAQTGNDRIDLMLADLSSQEQIRAFAAEFLARDLPLHLLLNNAGIMNLSRALTPDGLEETFAVNHLAYFLLTQLLLDRIVASAPARIVNVASDAHQNATLDFDDLNAEKSYRAMARYGSSKLANILFTRELARRLDGTGVTANCLHPGFVATGIATNNGLLGRVVMQLARLVARTPEKGAETSVYLCTSDNVAGVSGRYFVDCAPVEPAAAAQSDTDAARLWQVSEELTGSHPTAATPG
jgi:NAD(P)-dependent dehydrogenase (short-subunit alcohol dehydrogenase family)